MTSKEKLCECECHDYKDQVGHCIDCKKSSNQILNHSDSGEKAIHGIGTRNGNEEGTPHSGFNQTPSIQSETRKGLSNEEEYPTKEELRQEKILDKLEEQINLINKKIQVL